MSDTAYKIKVMQAFVDGKEVGYTDLGGHKHIFLTGVEPAWDWTSCQYFIKPEPLECWAVINNQGRLIQMALEEIQIFPDDCRIVRMRQVLDSDAE